jgi:hypothetical protein
MTSYRRSKHGDSWSHERRCCGGGHDAGEQLGRHQCSKTANTLARRRRRGRRRTWTRPWRSAVRPRAFLAKPDMGGGSTLPLLLILSLRWGSLLPEVFAIQGESSQSSTPAWMMLWPTVMDHPANLSPSRRPWHTMEDTPARGSVCTPKYSGGRIRAEESTSSGARRCNRLPEEAEANPRETVHRRAQNLRYAVISVGEDWQGGPTRQSLIAHMRWPEGGPIYQRRRTSDVYTAKRLNRGTPCISWRKQADNLAPWIVTEHARKGKFDRWAA